MNEPRLVPSADLCDCLDPNETSVTAIFDESVDTDEVMERLTKLADVVVPRGAQVLDAGCGAVVRVPLSPAKQATIVGIDISAQRLERNAAVHQKVHADLETVPLPADHYDLVVCWDVLEHLSDPRHTLARLVRATRPDGMIVIAMPNLLSLKGVITKLTPYRVHVWYHRRVLGWEHAGRDDVGPFRTPFRLSLRPRAVVRELAELGVEPVLAVYHRTKAMEIIRAQRGLLGVVIGAASAVLRVVSLGRFRTRDADVVIVGRRPADSVAADG
jgi:2-polyprenyl-3-methyl-5-hydroxy-6-metoxy-1,4-benzoquinol methylase